MSLSSGLYDNAELAMAAYADLVVGDVFVQKVALEDMSATQAEQFAARYPDVIAVQENMPSGFAATVFGSGANMTVAIRGWAVFFAISDR